MEQVQLMKMFWNIACGSSVLLFCFVLADFHVCEQISKEAIVEIYRNLAYMQDVYLTTLKGYRTVLQACWYLDLIKYGVQWQAFYACDPGNFNGMDFINEAYYWYRCMLSLSFSHFFFPLFWVYLIGTYFNFLISVNVY